MATATYAHAAHPHQHLGGQAFNPSPYRPSQSAHAHAGHSAADEAEYDRLRSAARHEHAQMQSCFSRSQPAEAHQHQAAAASYNAQASRLILAANNASSPPDVLDLHGQYVEEAAAILEARLHEARAQGLRGLHVIVGKGISTLR